jgi:integrase
MTAPALPAVPEMPDTTVPAHLEKLVETAKDYARGAKSAATLRAYASDWRHYDAWCAREDLDPLPPSAQVVGLYLAACAAQEPLPDRKLGSVRTIERRLSAIAWYCAQKGQPLDRADRHIREVMQGIRRKHGRPPDEKEAVLGDDIIRMIETLGRDLRGLRDRAILLLGFAGGFRRSEVVGLDCGPDQTKDGSGWIEILRHGRVVTKESGETVEVGEQGMIVHLRGKTGWREVEIGPGSSDHTFPIVALQTWLNLARVAHGPLFRRATKNGKQVGVDRLNDRHIVRLVKRTALAAGVRGDLSEADRRPKPFAARRPCHVRQCRRVPGPAAARSCQRDHDAALSAETGAVPSESDQSCGVIMRPGPGKLAGPAMSATLRKRRLAVKASSVAMGQNLKFSGRIVTPQPPHPFG